MNKEDNLLISLEEAINTNNKKRINEMKYRLLFRGYDLLDIVANYIVLSSYPSVEFNFGRRILKKGTLLYRIRRVQKGTNYSDPKEWGPPPKIVKQRANLEGEKVLYLGTTENVCMLETHIKPGEEYAIAKYEVIEDIELGGFLNEDSIDKQRSSYAVVILNAFLIAPSRNAFNHDLFVFLDERYKGIQLKDLDIKDAQSLELPLKIGTLFKKDIYYDMTNKILVRMKNDYPNGICYSSCYIPVPTIGIVCSDCNVALYESGIKKIKFIDYNIKTNTNKCSCLDVVKAFIQGKQ